MVHECLARLAQRLPVTEIEIATLAFAVINIFIWLLWWSKPLDVERPILIGPEPEPEVAEENGSEEAGSQSFYAALVTLLHAAAGNHNLGFDASSTSVPSFYSPKCRALADRDRIILTATASAVGVVFGGIHCVTWSAIFPSAVEMWMWRASALFIAAWPAFVGCWFVLFALALSMGYRRHPLQLFRYVGLYMFYAGA
ncbi:hypothetical protein B0H16DRAFT_1724867 [Mycena metata]|uniref:Uncharacterized protein n=1 Tax=Mycena metata TaxID=1033252 RepID=A0AAD7N838_9AGAR|nr:hypothetical protein B0H16DRAFT_1724867 [Mycena metata]